MRLALTFGSLCQDKELALVAMNEKNLGMPRR